MSETATVQVQEVKVGKTGTNQRGAWTRYDLLDGNGERFSTFSRELADRARPYIGKQAELEYEANDKGKNFTDIREVVAGNGDVPLGTGEYVTGQKPPIEVRRIAAATAWNNAARLTALLAPLPPETVFAKAKAFADDIFYDLLRKGKAMEDEDIPF